MKVEESIDLAFDPDVRVADGDVAATGSGLDDARRAHAGPHVEPHVLRASRRRRVLFPGDHVMGWSTTVVSPPDGDMAAYVESLRKVAGRAGPDVLADARAVDRRSRSATSSALVDHRLERERQVLDAVRAGLAEIPAIVAVLYADVDEELHKPAGRTVLAHLVKLVDDGQVRVAGGGRPRLASRYEPT